LSSSKTAGEVGPTIQRSLSILYNFEYVRTLHHTNMYDNGTFNM